MLNIFIPQRMREKFEQAKKEGCHCPLCGQYAQVYSRKISSAMAKNIIDLYKLYNSTPFGVEFFHYKEISNSHDMAKLEHWGLIERKPHVEGEKKSTGYWSITSKGIAFVDEGLEVLSKVFLYNNKVEGFSEETRSIQDCLGSKFNYTELMEGK